MPGPWSTKRKLLVGLAGTALVGALIVVNLLQENKKKQASEDIETVRVASGRVVEQLKETGRIEFVRTVEVKSTVSGEIVRLLAEPGDPVTTGGLLAVIEPDPNQTLQLYNKRAAVEQAQIDLEQLRKDLDRKERLLRRNLISQEEVDRLQDQYQKAQNTSRLARLELEILETRTHIRRKDGSPPGTDGRQPDNVRVLAPVSGIIIARPIEVGEVVVSGILSTVTGTSLFEIGDPSQMMVKADISEVDVGRLAPGQPVRIVADAYPDTTYRGEIHRIAPVGEIRAGNSIVTFDTEIRILDTDPRLRQGMSCDIDILFAQQDSTLHLPVEAVYEDFGQEKENKGTRGRFIAYRKQEGEFVEAEVEIGLKSDARLEIRSGLALEDEVAANAEEIHKKKTQEKSAEEPSPR